MAVDLTSVWYIARDGAIVWQGTAEQLLAWIDAGEIQGSEAAWTEGFDAWLPVSTSEQTAWIRDAVALHDDMTGELTEYSNPEGTAALRIPRLIDEGDSPFAGEQPRRSRQRAQRARPSVSIGLIIGIGIGVAVASTWSLWQGSAPSPSAPSAPSAAPKHTSAPPQAQKADAGAVTQESAASDAGKQARAQRPERDSGSLRPSASRAAAAPSTAPRASAKTVRDTGARADAGEPEAVKASTADAGTPSPAPAAKAPATPPAQPAKQVIRIIQKNKTGVALPQDSLNRADEIKRSMKVRKGVWDACIRRAQNDYPALVGRITFSISVTKEGRINGVTGPAGNRGAQYAAGCLLGEFESLKFPPGRAATVGFPYTTP
ncbi:MAG: hypothetical protein VYB65_08805 [Myxococcota bacterium]|nr:hypothetical protein [Myxococcota bacterium]